MVAEIRWPFHRLSYVKVLPSVVTVVAGPRLLVELSSWLVDTLTVPECSVCMDPVVGVFIFDFFFLHSRESIVHTVVERFCIVLAHINYSCHLVLVVTMRKESVLAASNRGLQISVSFRILEGSMWTVYSNIIKNLVCKLSLV